MLSESLTLLDNVGLGVLECKGGNALFTQTQPEPQVLLETDSPGAQGLPVGIGIKAR